MGERHLTIDARVAATRERSYICPPMKIDFESRARAPGEGRVEEPGRGAAEEGTGDGGMEGETEGESALLKHSFPDQEFVFLVTMPAL